VGLIGEGQAYGDAAILYRERVGTGGGSLTPAKEKRSEGRLTVIATTQMTCLVLTKRDLFTRAAVPLRMALRRHAVLGAKTGGGGWGAVASYFLQIGFTWKA
jgi:hypothetical protein